jgi:glycosyltransferase involved in cell wall biosynthesis
MPPIERLYQGIDPIAVRRSASVDGARDELGIPEHALVIGCVANFTPQKAHEYLLQAMARVRQSIRDVRLVLVGDGPREQDLRKQAHLLHLDDVVIFAGRRADVPRIAREFDVFALSSAQEGLSIALLEAMALGKPAVVTRAGGLTEVVEHERHGLLVPPADPQAMAESLCTLLRDEGTRLSMGREAQRRAEQFHISTAVRRTEDVYRELLGC